jgi:hypothetical protein
MRGNEAAARGGQALDTRRQAAASSSWMTSREFALTSPAGDWAPFPGYDGTNARKLVAACESSLPPPFTRKALAKFKPTSVGFSWIIFPIRRFTLAKICLGLECVAAGFRLFHRHQGRGVGGQLVFPHWNGTASPSDMRTTEPTSRPSALRIPLRRP